jgi:lipopolysaccharide export system permease protein
MLHRIIPRYLAASFIGPLILGGVFFVSFLLTFQLFRITRVVMNKDVEITQALELLVHMGISFFPMAIPLSALFATVYILNKLSLGSEIVAMRSFGFGKSKLLAPFLLVGLALATFIYTLNLNIIPYSKSQFKNNLVKLSSKGMLSNIRAGKFFTDIPNITLYSEKVSEDGKKLENVFIYVSDPVGTEEKVIASKKGRLIKEEAPEWKIPKLRLYLEDGNIIKTYKDSNNIEKIIFEEYDFPIEASFISPGFVTKDSMRSSKELNKLLSSNKTQIEYYQKLTNNKKIIPAQVKIMEDIVNSNNRTLIEFWNRINTPLQCLIFIFLGFGLGIKHGRRRTQNTGVIAPVVLAGYFGLFFIGVSYAKKGIVPPGIAMLLPGFLIFLVALHFYRKIDWPS